MDRRQFLGSSGAAALAVATPLGTLAQADGDTRVNALFEGQFQDAVAQSPALASSLGLDTGTNAGLKRRLDGRTAADRARDLARAQRSLARLKAVDRSKLSPAARLNLEVITYTTERQTIAPARFGLDSVVRPYRIFQQGGAYFSVPDFLNSAHTIRGASDAEAYLARLDGFATVLDQDTVEQRAQAARGYLAPGWSIDLTLRQLAKLRSASAAQSTLVSSLATRARAASIPGDWAARATAIVAGRVYPALDRQIAAMTALRPTSRPGDGVWRVPQGDAIYAAALAEATTTTLTPDQVHARGLTEVADISAQLDVILRGAGYTRGSVGARLAELNASPAQLYANTDAGRAELLASLNDGVALMTAKLPPLFATLPTQPLEIRRVPPEIQDGASNGYYRRATLDGSRPAIYFINLKDTGDWPKYTLPALTYHEGVPGHHLQGSIAQETPDLPSLRKTSFLSAYGEGWALYSEQLADEAGAFATPLERAGYLQSFLFRAARLVVDTGLHAKRWSRERATDYMVATTGFSRGRCQREVERYCTQPGQATSYKIGHQVWARAREEAKATLGARFDVKAFHEVLKDGPMPLTILERRIKERTAAMRG